VAAAAPAAPPPDNGGPLARRLLVLRVQRLRVPLVRRPWACRPWRCARPDDGQGGADVGDDLSKWEFWWEFNKDPFIRLKDAIHAGTVASGSDEFFLGANRRVEAKDTLSPTEDDKMNKILPALKKALDIRPTSATSTRRAWVAMAKIGKDHPDFKLLKDVFAPRLKKNDQEVSETAALSIGIAAIAEEDNVNLLLALAKDSKDGRSACDKSEVNTRTRAFATYGLGLIAYATSIVEVKTKIFAALRDLVNDDKISSRDIKVAAINAIGLLNVSSTTDADKALVQRRAQVPDRLLPAGTGCWRTVDPGALPPGDRQADRQGAREGR